jgi:hypothetical protein
MASFEMQWDPRLHPCPLYFVEKEPLRCAFLERELWLDDKPYETRDTKFVSTWRKDLFQTLENETSAVDWVRVLY